MKKTNVRGFLVDNNREVRIAQFARKMENFACLVLPIVYLVFTGSHL